MKSILNIISLQTEFI